MAVASPPLTYISTSNQSMSFHDVTIDIVINITSPEESVTQFTWSPWTHAINRKRAEKHFWDLDVFFWGFTIFSCIGNSSTWNSIYDSLHIGFMAKGCVKTRQIASWCSYSKCGQKDHTQTAFADLTDSNTDRAVCFDLYIQNSVKTAK